MIDFFPLVKGARLEYALEDSRGVGTVAIETLDVSTADTTTTAKCRRTTKRPNKPTEAVEFIVTRDASGVRSGESIEFKHPIAVGAEWAVTPRRFWIEALDAAVETPAGTFKNCLRVAYLIAEGDGGSGERLYASGIGLIKAVENDEAAPFVLQLVKASAR